MLERKPTPTPGKPLPKDWTDSVTQLLNQTYSKECDARGRQFDVFGQIYPQELLVIVGFVPKEESTEGAISCFLSCDAADIATEAKVKETQSAYVDLAGMFFDEVFANENWDEWEPQWQEVEWKERKFWYKMTRENVRLTLEADRLLREAGFEADEVVFDDDEEDKIIH